MTSRTGSSGARPARPAGFTLMELLVVITIIGILFGTVAVTMTGMGRRLRFEGDARKVHDKIMNARNVAVSLNRRVAVRITKTPLKRWKLIIVDSIDNVFDDNDEETYDPIIMKHTTFDADQEIELSPEGGISYWTSNPVILRDETEENDPWRMELTLYPGGGSLELGPVIKLTSAEKTARAATNAVSDTASVTNSATGNKAR